VAVQQAVESGGKEIVEKEKDRASEGASDGAVEEEVEEVAKED